MSVKEQRLRVFQSCLTETRFWGLWILVATPTLAEIPRDQQLGDLPATQIMWANSLKSACCCFCAIPTYILINAACPSLFAERKMKKKKKEIEVPAFTNAGGAGSPGPWTGRDGSKGARPPLLDRTSRACCSAWKGHPWTSKMVPASACLLALQGTAQGRFRDHYKLDCKLHGLFPG